MDVIWLDAEIIDSGNRDGFDLGGHKASLSLAGLACSVASEFGRRSLENASVLTVCQASGLGCNDPRGQGEILGSETPRPVTVGSSTNRA